MKLEVGYKSTFDIRCERYRSNTSDDINVLFFSDLHLNAYSEALIVRLKSTITTLNPDIIILGGDYVDNKKGLFHFDSLLSFLSKWPNVYVIAGNHDYFFGISLIEKCTNKYGVKWLENANDVIQIKETSIYLTNNLNDKEVPFSDIKILCLHQPVDIKTARIEFDLVFAGHLHGCQVVLWQSEKGLFPGRLFYKWNVLKTYIGNSLYIVSKGLGDTLPIRYNCSRDVVLVKIK